MWVPISLHPHQCLYCLLLLLLLPSQWVWSGVSPSLQFASPWWLMMLNIFSWTRCPCVPLLWRNVYSNSLPIFSWVVFKSSLYILDTRPLSHIGFVNIFSHPTDRLFAFLTVSSDAQVSILTESNSPDFSLVAYVFRVTSESPRSRRLSLLSSKTFTVLVLTCMSWMHFELVFVYCTR